MPDLRKLRKADARQIRSWPPYEGDMAQMDYALRENGWLEESRTKPGTLLFAVDDGDELVAFSILMKTGPAEAEFRIAVRADMTGLGLGESIAVKTLRIAFDDHRFSRVHLIVRKNNVRGIRLYRRIGFVEHGETRKEIHGEQVDFLMMDIRREEFIRSHELSGAERTVEKEES